MGVVSVAFRVVQELAVDAVDDGHDALGGDEAAARLALGELEQAQALEQVRARRVAVTVGRTPPSSPAPDPSALGQPHLVLVHPHTRPVTDLLFVFDLEGVDVSGLRRDGPEAVRTEFKKRKFSNPCTVASRRDRHLTHLAIFDFVCGGTARAGAGKATWSSQRIENLKLHTGRQQSEIAEMTGFSSNF